MCKTYYLTKDYKNHKAFKDTITFHEGKSAFIR